MSAATNIQLLAENQVDTIFDNYFTNSDKNRIILAAIDEDYWMKQLFDRSIYDRTEIIDLVLEFIRSPEVNHDLPYKDDYAVKYPHGVVIRTILVGLAAAAIGASIGLAGNEIHPTLTAIVGAESAVLLNVLSSFLLDKTVQENKIDGLDLAVLSVIQKGHYTSDEIAKRISDSIKTDEIDRSISKLVTMKLAKEGDWKNTYISTEEGKAIGYKH